MGGTRWVSLFAVLVVLSLVVAPGRGTSSDAQPSAGPEGGEVSVLYPFGAALYAGTGAGSATDSGGRIFKSSDDGQSWSPADAGLANVNIRDMTSHAGDLYIATSGGVYKSSDDGATWSQKVQGLTQWNDFAVAVTSNGDVYVGTHSAGVFKSAAGLVSWSPVNSGISNLRISSLLADGNDLYAGTDGQSAGVAPQVYKSVDGGASWSATAFPDLGNYVEVLHVHDGILYAGLHLGGVVRTPNGGASWEVADTGIPRRLPAEPSAVTDLWSDGATLYASHFLGIAATTDGGDSWSDVSNGAFSREISCGATSGNRLLGGAIAGVWASDNGGSSWTLSNSGLYASNVFSLAALTSGRILAGTYGGGVYLSDDVGRSWALPSTPLEDYWIRGTAETATHLFASAWANGVLRSADDGLIWRFSLITSGPRRIVTIGSEVYVATNDGVYKTSNAGDDWAAVNTGLSDTRVLDLLAHDGDLYAATITGIFKSTNGGAQWFEKSTGLTTSNVHGLTATASGDLYAAVYTGGVFKSQDAAESWEDVTSDLPNTLAETIQGVGDDVVVGLLLGGVYRSSNGGASWLTVDLGRDYRGQAFLVVDDELFIGTDSAGVLFMPVPEPGVSAGGLLALATLAGLRRRFCRLSQNAA